MKLKKMKLAGLILMTLCVGCWSSASAQRIGTGALHFQVGFPQGDFKDNIDNNSYGGNAEFFYSPGKNPLGIGIAVGYGVYGSESRKEPFSTTIPDVTVNVTTTNNIFLSHLVLRAGAKKGAIRPYADGLVGLSYLFTSTEISDASDGSKVASSTNFHDAVFSYGGGGGVMIPVVTSHKGQNSEMCWMIDAGARYLVGGEAEYLKEGSIRRNGGKVEYDSLKSKTNILTARIGLTVSF